MATTFTIPVSLGTRREAGTTLSWKNTSRHPPQSAEILSNSDLIQRRAAPIPRVCGEGVGEGVSGPETGQAPGCPPPPCSGEAAEMMS